MLQVISTVLFYLILVGFLWLLWRIERNSAVNAQALQVLSTVALKNAESVQKTAEAVYLLAKSLEAP